MCVFLDTLWARIGFLDREKLIELSKLPLEAHVGKNYRSALTSERKCFLKLHATFLHEVCNYARGAARDTGVAMDEHATRGYAFLDKGDSCWEMPHQLETAGIRNRYNLVLEVLRKEGLNAIGDL